MLQDPSYYLHCVCFTRGGLSIGEYGPIVAIQNVCTKHKTETVSQDINVFPGLDLI